MRFAATLLALPILALGVLSITSATFGEYVATAAITCLALLYGLAVLATLRSQGLSTVERIAFAVAVGLGVEGSVGFALGIAGAFRPGVVLALALVLAAVAAVIVRRSGMRRPTVPTLSNADLAVLAACVLFVSTTLIFIPAPETLWDPMWYHLPVAQALAETGALAPLPHLFQSYWAFMLGEVLYGIGTLFSSVAAARYLNFVAGIESVVVVFAIGARLRGTSTGLVASALWLSTPLVLAEMTKANVDLLAASYGGLALLAAIIWQQERSAGAAALCGLCIGFGLATKLNVGLVAVGLLVALGAFSIRGRADLRHVGVAALAIVATALPWYVRGYVLTGSPVYPYLNGVFRSPLWLPTNDVTGDLSRWGRGPLDLALLPYRLIAEPFFFCQAERPCLNVLPPLLVIVPLLLSVRGNNVRVRILSLSLLVATLLWFSFLQDLRYLMVVLPAGIAIVAIPIAYLIAAGGRAVARVRFVALAGTLLLVPIVSFVAWRGLDKVPWRVSLGLESREAYLSRTLRYYDVYRWVDDNRAERPRAILLVGFRESSVMYSRAPLWIADRTIAGLEVLASAGSAETLARLRSGGFDHLLIDAAPYPSEASNVPLDAMRAFAEGRLAVVHRQGAITLYRVP